MSFKLFIYYCSLGGGWAAFFTWAVMRFLDFRETKNGTHNLLTGARENIEHLGSVSAFAFIAHDVSLPLDGILPAGPVDGVLHMASAASPAIPPPSCAADSRRTPPSVRLYGPSSRERSGISSP